MIVGNAEELTGYGLFWQRQRDLSFWRADRSWVDGNMLARLHVSDTSAWLLGIGLSCSWRNELCRGRQAGLAVGEGPTGEVGVAVRPRSVVHAVVDGARGLLSSWNRDVPF